MRQAEVGVVITISTVISLAGATLGKLRLRSPSGVSSEITVTTEVQAAGAATSFTYTTKATDFPEAGNYDLQLRVDFTAAKQLVSKRGKLEITEAIPAT